MPTVDIPATLIAIPSPGNGLANVSAAFSAVDASGPFLGSQVVNIAQWFSHFKSWMVIEKYGTGPNLFNWDMPAGAVVTDMKYVLRAYREGSWVTDPADVTVIAATSDFGKPVPASSPVAIMRHTTRGYTDYFPDMYVGTTWGPVYEIEIDEPDPAAVLAGNPFDQLTTVQSSSLSAVVKGDYLAIRITYDASTGIPPRRGWPRHQATTAARGIGGRDDIQTGPRGIGSVV